MKRPHTKERMDSPSFIPVTDEESDDKSEEVFPKTNRSSSPTRSSSHSSTKPRKPQRHRVNTSPVPNSPLAPAPRFGPSAPNPNANWQNKKGTWLTNLVIIWTIRLMFAVIPGISKEMSWTLTNCAYGLVEILSRPRSKAHTE